MRKSVYRSHVCKPHSFVLTTRALTETKRHQQYIQPPQVRLVPPFYLILLNQRLDDRLGLHDGRFCVGSHGVSYLSDLSLRVENPVGFFRVNDVFCAAEFRACPSDIGPSFTYIDIIASRSTTTKDPITRCFRYLSPQSTLPSPRTQLEANVHPSAQHILHQSGCFHAANGKRPNRTLRPQLHTYGLSVSQHKHTTIICYPKQKGTYVVSTQVPPGNGIACRRRNRHWILW